MLNIAAKQNNGKSSEEKFETLIDRIRMLNFGNMGVSNLIKKSDFGNNGDDAHFACYALYNNSCEINALIEEIEDIAKDNMPTGQKRKTEHTA